jgi:ketosteroid isomerase-like protein
VDIADWIDAYARAWRDCDPDAVVAIFTEDAIYRSSPFREPHLGSDGIHAYWESVTASQTNLDLRFGTPVVQGNSAAVEWWAIVEEGEDSTTFPGILMLRFGPDGRCQELRECWHARAGRTEPHDGWGA